MEARKCECGEKLRAKREGGYTRAYCPKCKLMTTYCIGLQSALNRYKEGNITGGTP